MKNSAKAQQSATAKPSKDDLSLFVLNGIIATGPDVFEALATPGIGLAPVIKILKADYNFRDGFFDAPKGAKGGAEKTKAGPGYSRLRRLRDSLLTPGKLVQVTLSEDYPPGSSHRNIVKAVISLIKK